MGKMYIGTESGKKEITLGGAFNKTSGQQLFTSSGTFTVPTGVYFISIFLVGGGQSGGYSQTSYRGVSGAIGYQYTHTYGGASGCTRTISMIPVVPGSKHTVTIGSGGVSSAPDTADIKNSYGCARGGDTSFDDFIAKGGCNTGGQGLITYNIEQGTVTKEQSQQDGRHAFGQITNTEYAKAGNPTPGSVVTPSSYGDGGCIYWSGGPNGQSGTMTTTYKNGKSGICIIKW